MSRETTEQRRDLRSSDGRVSGAPSGRAPSGHHRPVSSWAGWVVALVPLALTIGFASLIGPVAGGSAPMVNVAWVPDGIAELACNVVVVAALVMVMPVGEEVLLLKLESPW